MGKFVLQKTSTKTQYYWVLKADNEEVIATSETYTTKAAAEKGIESCRGNAPTAALIDITPYQ